MKLNVLDIVLIILFFQLLTLVPYLIFYNGKRQLSNKIFAGFLLAKALCILNFLSFRLYDYTYSYFPHLFYFGSSFTILWGPLLYLYTKSLLSNENKLKTVELLHFIPFLTHFLYLSVIFHFHNAEYKRDIISSGIIFPGNLKSIIYTGIQFSILVYVILAFCLVIRYHKSIKKIFSNIDRINLNWMYFVLFGFFLKWGFDMWYVIPGLAAKWQSAIPLILSRITLFAFINIMIFKVLKHPSIFTGIERFDIRKQKRLSLSESLKSQYQNMLETYMKEEKLYMNPDISLKTLSEKTGIPSRSLSEVINSTFQNFYDFINHYRVKESVRLFSEEPERYKTILEVLYEVGFNNKGSFNNAFKKFTGITPREYKSYKKLVRY